MTQHLKFLAFETSTDMMSVALSHGDQSWHLHTTGGPNASAQLIPTIHQLLAQAQMQLKDLTALVMGQGPGSFTGLRTACSVAQGLALGANLKVIPVDTLMVVAEDARGSMQAGLTSHVSVVMDARMGEVYGGAYEWQADLGQWQPAVPLQVGPPAQVAHALITEHTASHVLAGNGFEVYPDAFSDALSRRGDTPLTCVRAVPHALALLRLAPALWAAGRAVAPEGVQPLYIRDKVAQTTAERNAIKAAKAAGQTSEAP
ncbi:MAG: tRNA threonylcarbamoyladenosine biosynthesis protein TsaB [Pseudomonadota bacterium]|jgi:tRNA threonylcarbamoyladenosine biosynthesis protein TsaB